MRTVLQIVSFINGADERGRMIRRTLARYLNLIAVLTLQCTSVVVKKRFPTIDHIVGAGLMTKNERKTLEETVAPHGKWWIPSVWFCNLVMEARKEGRIHDDIHLKSIIDVIKKNSCNLNHFKISKISKFQNKIYGSLVPLGNVDVPRKYRNALELRLGFGPFGLYPSGHYCGIEKLISIQVAVPKSINFRI